MRHKLFSGLVLAAIVVVVLVAFVLAVRAHNELIDRQLRQDWRNWYYETQEEHGQR